MKKISLLSLACWLFSCLPAVASVEENFKSEVLTGLDIVSVQETFEEEKDMAPGELGAEVYQTVDAVQDENIKLFIPADMYLRIGAGYNLGFATSNADFFGVEKKSNGGIATQIGLGWNLSSFVRTELELQEATLQFKNLDNLEAGYQTVGASLYFDFAKRYVQYGDITYRRTFVPFMGVGVAVGQYEFAGSAGHEGLLMVAPKAMLGLNIKLNDLIGLDITYQYQMMLGSKFGWGIINDDTYSVSNVMASFRVNF